MPARRTARTLRPPAFLNVDLEIESTVKLDLLLVEWGERVFVLYSGPGHLDSGPALKSRRWLLTLEIDREAKNPDTIIRAFCDLIEGLSPAQRQLWDRARKRFDAGYELRPAETWTHAVLHADTLARMAKLGAGFAVSVYRGKRKQSFRDKRVPEPEPGNEGKQKSRKVRKAG